MKGMNFFHITKKYAILETVMLRGSPQSHGLLSKSPGPELTSIGQAICTSISNLLAFLLLSLWFRTLLENHSSDVEPVSKFFSGMRATASAIIGLSSTNARKIIEFPGRVKKTRDHRSKCACVFGGEL